MAEEWELCLDWLQRCRVLPREFLGKDVSDFAQCLRDGVILCQLIVTLKPSIDLKEYHLRPQMSQFLCLKNIRYFLNACREHFGMRSSDLFDSYDLFDLKDFKKVMTTLSTLSITDIAQLKVKPGFQHQDDDIYKNLDELNLSEMPDEDIYGPIANEEESDQIYEDLCSVKPRTRASMAVPGAPKTKTDFCIEEILVTERNYVDALHMITERFMKVLGAGILNPTDMALVFTNIEELYKVHQDVLRELEAAVLTNSMADMAKIFIKKKKDLVLYAEYCAGLPIAQNKVDEIVKCHNVARHTIADCEQQANEGRFRLRDLLVVPMQRVMKYSLLLLELKKNLDKDRVFDREAAEMKEVEKAVAVMQDLAYYVNEVKRDKESLHTINTIEQNIDDLSMPPGTKLEDYGHLLKDGELKVKFHDDNRELKRYIFLFDKVMLMCKSKGETYSYKTALVLHNYRLEDVANGPIKVLQWKHSFMLIEKEKTTAITFFAKNEDQKRKWVESINLAIENFSPPFSKENGFDFMMHTFSQATECDACNKLLAGCFYQGYLCSNSKKKVHKHCIERAVKQTQKRPKYVAIHVYQGLPPPPLDKTVLKFVQGDMVEVENTDSPDWWYGNRNGMAGYFPSIYVQKHSTRASVSTPNGQGGVSRRHNSTSWREPRSSISKQNSQESSGYYNIDRLENHPWYIGTFNKAEASHKLAAQDNGVFLVRESKDKPGTYAIGIAYQGTAKHIKITKKDREEVYSIADFKSFDSIVSLVKYYQSHTLQDSFPELTTTLLIPFNSRASRRSMPPIIGKARVSFDYSSKETNQINLSTGDIVAIISKAGGDRGWWKGAVIKHDQLGRIGYFPLAYVEEIDDEHSPFH